MTAGMKWRKRAAFFAVFVCVVVVAGWALGDVRLSETPPRFVPAAAQTQALQYTLAVRGLVYPEAAEAEAEEATEAPDELADDEFADADGQAPETVLLPGAVFGVYAPDADGVMQPWPDPRAPQSPYLIRTEGEPVGFSLPEGIDFFLRQESAPEGYRAASGDLPIGEQKEIVIENAMPGRLAVTAQDEDGNPIAGVKFTLRLQDTLSGETAADGSWRAKAPVAGMYALACAEAPEEYLPAKNPQRNVDLRDGANLEEIFVFQRMGRLIVQAERFAMHPTGQAERKPLAGVELTVVSGDGALALDARTDKPIAWSTDANGLAQGALLAGEYILRVTRQPQGAPAQLAEETPFTIENGEDTELALSARENEGYVRFETLGGLEAEAGEAEAERVPLASVRCVIEQNGKPVGTVVTDAAGVALSGALIPGEYTVRYEEIPAGYALPEALRKGQKLAVAPAALTEALALCPPVLSGRWMLCIGEVREDGGVLPQPVGETELEVLHEDGQPVLDEAGKPMRLRTEAGGGFSLTLPGGDYLLKPKPNQPSLARAVAENVAFSLPQEADTVVLPGVKTRIIVHSVQTGGARLGGVAYRVVDQKGETFDLETGEQGSAASMLVEPGSYTIETVQSAEGFGDAEPCEVTAEAGTALEVTLEHKPHGRLEAQVSVKALDSQGNAVQEPASGAQVRLLREGEEEALALALRTDAQGVVRDAAGELPALPEGTYRVAARIAPDGEAESVSEPFEMRDGEQSKVSFMVRAAEGGVRVTLRDAQDAALALADAAFELVPSEGESEALALTTDAQGAALRVQLAKGQYRLRQTRCPEGYDPAPEQAVEVQGGALTELSLTNARRGTLSVSRLGYTFNAEMQPFRVPLQGAYGVYTQEGEAYKPYPSEAGQVVLTTGGLAEEGGAEWAAFPAAPEGVTYYLRQISTGATQGYLNDEEYHPAQVFSGQHTVAEIAATVDRGFFVLTNTALGSGEAIPGAQFALYAQQGERDGQPVWEEAPALTFTLEGASYQNEMALPVGAYRLEMRRAAPGYMLDTDVEPTEQVLEIPAYARRGNPMAKAELRSAPIPKPGDATVAVIHLPLLNVRQEQRIYPPEAQADILAVSVGAARDAQDTPIAAQVVYRLRQGGWNWSDMRTVTGLESGARTVDLSDVKQRIVAVQVRYLNARDGGAQLGAGFSADEVRLTLAQQDKEDGEIRADWFYTMWYRDEQGERHSISSGYDDAAIGVPERLMGKALRPEQDGATTGGIAGIVRRSPDAKAAGALGVRLERIDVPGKAEQIAEIVPEADGSFALDQVPLGTYRLRIAPPPGELLAESPQDEEPGFDEPFTLDAAQRWHWAQAETMLGASVRGALWLDADLDGARGAKEQGAPGIPVSLWQNDTQIAEGTTDAQGGFSAVGLYPGEYTLRVALPQDTVFAKAAQQAEQKLVLTSGQILTLPDAAVVRQGRIAGAVRADGERGVEAAKVELLREGAETPLATVATDAQGGFAFAALMPGNYQIQVTLPEGAVLDGTQEQPWQRIALAMGEAKDGLLVRAVRPATLTVALWEDRRYAGERAEGDPGVSGVKLALMPAGAGDAGDIAWQQSGPDGLVRFETVPPGEYTLLCELPEGWGFTRDAGVGEAFTLSPAQAQELSVGLMLPATVRGAVWHDADDNGLWDAGERPYEGAEVLLESAEQGGEPLRATTDALGAYALEQVPPGQYRLTFALPEGHVFGGKLEGTRELALVLGQRVEHADMGLVQTASVSGSVWEDADDDGQPGEGEDGLASAHVRLFRIDEARKTQALVAETDTDDKGGFAFEGLRPATYRMECQLPEGYVVARAAASTVRFAAEQKGETRSDTFALPMGANIGGVSLGAIRLGEIGGAAWIDNDYDGQRAEEEAALSGVAVSLLREGADAPVATTVTKRDGAFRFAGLRPGEYRVRFTLPEGYLYTRDPERLLLDIAERQADIVVTLAMGETVGEVRVGALQPALLGGVLWEDTNNDGLLDAGEPPLAGVSLKLARADAPEEAYELTTDAQGRWQQDQLMPGSYALRAALPEGYLFAAEPARKSASRAGNLSGIDAAEGESAPIALEAGQRQNAYHIGAIPAAEISGQAWLDEDNDGLLSASDKALPDAEVSLLADGKAVRTARTDASGAYAFTGLRPGVYQLRFALPDAHLFARAPGEAAQGGLVQGVDASQGDSQPFTLTMGERRANQNVGALAAAAITGKLWLDADEDNAIGAGEEGLPGALIECLLAEDAQVLASARTDADGAYAFENLRPGTYQIRVTLGETELFTEQAAALFAQAEPQLGQTAAQALAMGQRLEMPDTGALRAARIQGSAWEDADVNGLQGGDEPPLEGAQVTLLRQEGGAWNTVAAQQVSEAGDYAFEALHPGRYKLRFELPGGYLFTLQSGGEGGSVAPATDESIGESEEFALAMGESRARMSVGGIRPGLIGDTAWVDTNGNGLQDFGEPPLPGVVLTLYAIGEGDSQREVATATTDEYGLYRFDRLRPGRYLVGAELPEGYAFTVNRPDLSEIDSDFPELAGASGSCEEFTLKSGQAKRDIDVGAKK